MGFGDILKINRSDDAPVSTNGGSIDNPVEKSLIKYTEPNVEKVGEKLEWKSREEVIRDTERYFDAFLEYLCTGDRGYKKEDIKTIALYPSERGLALVNKSGSSTKYSNCPIYDKYKAYNTKAAVNDFNSLTSRLAALRFDDAKDVITIDYHGYLAYIQKIGKYFALLNTDKGATRDLNTNPKKEEEINSCLIYLSDTDITDDIELDARVRKQMSPNLKRVFGYDD